MDHTPACLTNRNSAAPGLARIEAQFGDLVRYGETMRNQGRIRTECIAAALTRTNGTKGFICQSPLDRKPRNITPGKTDSERANRGPCITPELVDHIAFVTNQALACMGELDQPINPEIVFRKINNESGYHFYKAYSGGIGVGQLTSIAARQVLSGTTPVYQRFKENMSPACLIFKRPVMEMESRLEGASRSNSSRGQTGTATPTMEDLRQSNWCHIISSSNGIAANTMISLLYFAHTRANIVERTIRPVLASNRISDVSSQQRFIDLATLGAFGPDGNQGAMNLVAPLRSILQSAKPSDSEFLDRAYARFSEDAQKHVGYLGDIQKKAEEVIGQIPAFNRISGRNFTAKSTADCVEPAVPTR
ncbi:MAG: hypothetical protein ACK5P5_08450 [Pseudobdellovibrionaceae bacterium]